jgi:hypothetical protein
MPALPQSDPALRRDASPAADVERHGLMRVAAETPDFEILATSVERIVSVGDGCTGLR